MVHADLDRARLSWWAFGGVLGGVILFVIYSFVGTFVFGIFIYYATRPIYRRLKRRIRPPSLAAAVALFALALPALLLMLYAVAIVLREFDRVLSDGQFDPTQYLAVDPTLLARIRDPASLVETDFSTFVSAGSLNALGQSLGQAADTVAFLGIGAVHLFAMSALAFYLLRDDHKLSRWVTSRFGDDRGVLEEYLRAVDSDFHNIFFGNILNAVLTGTIGVIVYSLLNVVAPSAVKIPAPPLVGLIAGVASLIPVVGMKLVYVPVAGVMAAQAIFGGGSSLWFVALFVVVSFVVVDTIPDLVLRPYISGRSLHVGSVMIAYTLGPLLFGWYGIFLMPILLILVMQFARVVLPELLRPEPLRPYAVDPGIFEPPVQTESGGLIQTDENTSEETPTD